MAGQRYGLQFEQAVVLGETASCGSASTIDTGGVVGLYGAVNTAAEKQKAGRHVRTVQGVVDVRNELTVRP